MLLQLNVLLQYDPVKRISVPLYNLLALLRTIMQTLFVLDESNKKISQVPYIVCFLRQIIFFYILTSK